MRKAGAGLAEGWQGQLLNGFLVVENLKMKRVLKTCLYNSVSASDTPNDTLVEVKVVSFMSCVFLPKLTMATVNTVTVVTYRSSDLYASFSSNMVSIKGSYAWQQFKKIR